MGFLYGPVGWFTFDTQIHVLKTITHHYPDVENGCLIRGTVVITLLTPMTKAIQTVLLANFVLEFAPATA